MAIKKHDFIEIEYTGRLKDNNLLFDTTDQELAKKEDMFQENMEYGPVIICIGENQVLDGIDSKLVGKNPGDYKFEFPAEQAFGKKDAKLIQLLPTSKFTKQGIRAMPGLQVDIDGTMGVIRTVTGGRTLVDFNHPLSGKEVFYEIKVNRIVTDIQEQADAYLNVTLRIKDKKIEIKDDIATIITNIELPDELTEMLKEKMKEIFKFSEINFSVEKEDDKALKTEVNKEKDKEINNEAIKADNMPEQD